MRAGVVALLLGSLPLGPTGATAIAGETFPTAAPATGGFEIEDYFRLQRIAELALSSDGTRLIYVPESFDPASRARVRGVYSQSLRESRPAVLVADLAEARNFAFIPGTHDIAFVCARERGTQVCVREESTGAIRARTQSAHPVESFLFSPDGRSLAYTTRAAAAPGESLYEQFRDAGAGILVDPASTSSHDFLNPHWNPSARPQPPKLWVQDAHGPAREVAVPGDPMGEERTYFWSSDSRMLSITYVAREVPDSWMRGEHTSIGVLDLATRRFRPLAVAVPPRDGKAWHSFRGGEWIPRRGQVLLRRIVEDDPWVSDSFPSWAVLDVSGSRSIDDLAWRAIEAYPRGLQFLPVDSTQFLVENTVAAVRSLFRLDAAGSKRVEWLDATAGSNALFRASSDFGTVVFVNESLVRPPEVYVRREGAAPRRLSNLNDTIAKRVRHRSREVRWKSSDGAMVQGWLLEPIAVPPPWPTITHVHGGPAFPYPDAFAPYFSYWPYPLEVYTSRGMAVFLPNYRGTHTFGRRIASPTAREPFEDVVSGVEHLIATGIADPARLGISGHSHGAVVGPRAMGAYRRFAAASFAEGVPNTVVMYEVMSEDANREIHDRVMGASLYEDAQRYLQDSPGLHLSAIETASLFEGGAYTAGLFMLGYAKATRRAGVPTELIVYPATAHNIALPELQAEAAQRNLDWFSFWLSGRADRSAGTREQFARWQEMKVRRQRRR